MRRILERVNDKFHNVNNKGRSLLRSGFVPKGVRGR